MKRGSTAETRRAQRREGEEDLLMEESGGAKVRLGRARKGEVSLRVVGCGLLVVFCQTKPRGAGKAGVWVYVPPVWRGGRAGARGVVSRGWGGFELDGEGLW